MNNKNKLNYPLNFQEMQYLNPDADIYTYDEFTNLKKISNLFLNTHKVIILYLLQSKYMGHYTTLFINDSGIQYFDSFGKPIDFWLDLLTTQQRIEYNEKSDILELLLKPYNVNYNEYLLQSKNTDTCGMFVTHRLHNYLLTENQYLKKYFMGKTSPDLIVANYVLKYLKKK